MHTVELRCREKASAWWGVYLAHAHAFQLDDLTPVLIVAGVTPEAFDTLALLGRRGVINLQSMTPNDQEKPPTAGYPYANSLRELSDMSGRSARILQVMIALCMWHVTWSMNACMLSAPGCA